MELEKLEKTTATTKPKQRKKGQFIKGGRSIYKDLRG
jgi:hypothetical protein